MAIIRGPGRGGFDDEPTRRAGPSDPYAERTRVAKRSSERPTMVATPERATDDEKTRLVGARAAEAVPLARDFLDDPVVGWLVIVGGPGKGRSLQLGYGQNSIGRAAGQRVRLDFGDDQISREAHAFVSYDPRGRKFYVANGAGSNLLYIGDGPVLAPTDLAANTELTLGGTTLRFVPLCGNGFDWREDPPRGEA